MLDVIARKDAGSETLNAGSLVPAVLTFVYHDVEFVSLKRKFVRFVGGVIVKSPVDLEKNMEFF